MSKPSRSRPEPTAHVDLEYPSSVPTFTVNPANLSSSSTPLPWFSAFGRKDADSPLPPEVDPKYSDPAYYASSSTYGKNGRNASHTAKKPEGHIKRPPNCFLLFRSHVKESGIRIPEALKPLLKDRLREKRKEQKGKKGKKGSEEDDEDDDDDEDDNDDDEQSVSKISGILWDFLPAAEKSFFRARAAHAKAQHKKLYPNYKYSPQVKDKTVKRRVGKKMPTEKRERLEEVAGVLVREMGWATGDVNVNAKRSSPSPSHSAPPAPPPSDVPGTSAFGIQGYEHHLPPMSAIDPPSSYPKFERRPSSCPPPNANVTWSEPAPVTTPVYVRPGGRTVRKMRTGPTTAKAQLLNGKPKRNQTVDVSNVGGGMTLPSLSSVVVPTLEASGVPMSTSAENWGPSHWVESGQNSPQAFSTAPSSVLLETPPFLAHPQLQQYHPHVPQPQASYDPVSAAPLYQPHYDQHLNQPHYEAQPFDIQQQQYESSPYEQPQPQYEQPQVSFIPEPTVSSNGELGLTVIDQNYTFPPPNFHPSQHQHQHQQAPPSPPSKAPSQRDASVRNKFSKVVHHNPVRGKRGSPTRRTPPPPPSPTTLDGLGVELDLNNLTELDSSSYIGIHFGGNLLGGANANVLLGDVALGMHDDGLQGPESFTAQYQDAAASLGPLDVPLQALYSDDPQISSAGVVDGSSSAWDQFDPTAYLAEADELKMTTTQQLEFQMMEWRRGSGSQQQQHPYINFGADVGVALYGFDSNGLGTVIEEQEHSGHGTPSAGDWVASSA